MPRTTIRTDDVNAAAAIAQSKLATIAADALSGNMIDGGTISNFASTGIDDNADAVAVTINTSEIVGVGTTSPLGTRAHVFGSGTQHVSSGSDGTRELIVEGANIPLSNSMGNIAIISNSTQAIDTGGQMSFMGKVSSSDEHVSTHAVITGKKENNSDGNFASYLAFSTRANGAGNVEKFRISSLGNIVMSGYGGIGNYLATMGDDTVTSITPSCNRGIIFVGSNSTHFGAGAYACINGGGQEAYILLNSSGTLNFTTGVLANGTAGTDGKLNISPANDGKIYFNNRLGGGAGVWYTMVGAMW